MPRYVGLDLLGLAKMDVKMLVRELRKLPQNSLTLGWMAGRFGDANPKARELLKTGVFEAARVQLGDGAGHRNGLLTPDEPRPYQVNKLAERLRAVKRLSKDFPKVKFFISFYCEHDEKSAPLGREWREALLKEFPEATMINSVFSGSHDFPGFLELHGNKLRAYAVSNDGKSLSDAEKDYINHGSSICLAWLHTFNGRGPGDENFVQPKERKAAWFCDAKDIRYCLEWLRGEQTKPAVPGKPIKAPELLKPYAEYYSQEEDSRERKPMLASKISVKAFKVVATAGKSAGKEIGEFRFYPGKLNGLNRYYSTLHSTDIMAKNGGSQWVQLKSSKGTYLANVIYRQGIFRDE